MKIDRHIPIQPVKVPRRGEKFKLALSMEVGDSFKLDTQMDRMSALSFLIKQYDGRKYISRTQDDGTFRIWGTA